MITLYTKDNCPYCDGAKALLKSMNEEYVEMDSILDENRNFLVSNGHKTVPQIYFEGKLLVEGGYTGLSKLTAQQLREHKRVIREG